MSEGFEVDVRFSCHPECVFHSGGRPDNLGPEIDEHIFDQDRDRIHVHDKDATPRLTSCHE